MIASLVLFADKQEAIRVSEATKGLLAFSRNLMLRLCEDNTVLSSPNAQEQLRVNQAHRKLFAVAQELVPNVYHRSFGEEFSPPEGWKTFIKHFETAPLATVRAVDSFWEIDDSEC